MLTELWIYINNCAERIRWKCKRVCDDKGSNCVLCISPVFDEDRQALREFCRERGFDECANPWGLQKSLSNPVLSHSILVSTFTRVRTNRKKTFDYGLFKSTAKLFYGCNVWLLFCVCDSNSLKVS
jgi:hypothetical protein